MAFLELWMIYLILALIAITFEIFVPAMFCINFAFAGIITAILSLWWGNFSQLLIVFTVLSLLSIIFIKPLLLKLLKKNTNADFEAQYIGKIVKSIEPINTSSGAVTLYDERWEARLNEGNEEIPADCDVKIVRNDSLILYVERI